MLKKNHFIMSHIQQTHFIFFWGHQPKKDGSFGKSCLSQWFPSPIYIGDIMYPTAEHYIMAEKARLFNDEETRQLIIHAQTPREAKMLGRAIKNFDQEQWEKQRYDIALAVNREKFSQNNALRAFLYSTRGSQLVEASPNDTIWGIGLAADNPDALVPEKWRGLNVLGNVLTDVREKLYTHVILLPISANQWLEIDFCKPLQHINKNNIENTPIWFVNHHEPRFDITDHFIDWYNDFIELKNIIIDTLCHNTTDISLHLTNWSAWSSSQKAPILTMSSDTLHTWLLKVDEIINIIKDI